VLTFPAAFPGWLAVAVRVEQRAAQVLHERVTNPFRRGRVLDGPTDIPLSRPRRSRQLDPAWQPPLPDTPGIELE
jgi:hypothetical protein